MYKAFSYLIIPDDIKIAPFLFDKCNCGIKRIEPVLAQCMSLYTHELYIYDSVIDLLDIFGKGISKTGGAGEAYPKNSFLFFIGYSAPGFFYHYQFFRESTQGHLHDKIL